MNYRFWLRATIPVLFLAALPVFSGAGRKTLSSTTGFLIDGKRFLVGNPSQDELSGTHPIIFTEVREVPGISPPPALTLPHGFRPERALRLESGAGPVDLAFGDTDAPNRTLRNKLSASEWQSIDRDDLPNGLSVATRKKGKEISVVFLEEKRGKFLLIRRME